MSIAVTPELEARLAAKKAAWRQDRVVQDLPSWTCLACRHRIRAAQRPPACPKCAAVTHEDDVKVPGACSAKGCRAPATTAPVLRVWPTAIKSGAPANLAFENSVACASCAARLTIADFVTPAFQAQLDQAWAKAGKDPINWGTAELCWTPTTGETRP